MHWNFPLHDQSYSMEIQRLLRDSYCLYWQSGVEPKQRIPYFISGFKIKSAALQFAHQIIYDSHLRWVYDAFRV
jgi:hypothetical protein